MQQQKITRKLWSLVPADVPSFRRVHAASPAYSALYSQIHACMQELHLQPHEPDGLATNGRCTEVHPFWDRGTAGLPQGRQGALPAEATHDTPRGWVAGRAVQQMQHTGVPVPHSHWAAGRIAAGQACQSKAWVGFLGSQAAPRHLLHSKTQVPSPTTFKLENLVWSSGTKVEMLGAAKSDRGKAPC